MFSHEKYFFENPRRDLRFTVLGQREYLCMNRQSDYTADHLPITNFKGDLSDTLVLGGWAVLGAGIEHSELIAAAAVNCKSKIFVEFHHKYLRISHPLELLFRLVCVFRTGP